MYDPRSQELLNRILAKDGLGDSLDAHLKLRLAGNFPEIFHLFHTLYPLRDDLWDHLEQLVHVLIKNNRERPTRLKKLDQKREQDPHWFMSEKWAGMMLYVDRFAGNLKSFEEKLAYLEELGINLVHLMPILKCPDKENDGGYAVSDYRSINPAIGTMEDVKALASHLHQKDMILMMDLVLNHTSDQHEWAMKAKSGDQTYQSYYYFFPDRAIPDQFEQSLPQVFPDMAPGNFTFIPEANQWVMTVFHNYQWDLNYSNPQVFIEMVDVILFLANQGIDVLRLDALAFMWKKIGTTSQNLDEAHQVIKAMKSCSRVSAPGVLFLAEAIVSPPEIIKYFGEAEPVSNECDLAYNATLMTLLWDTIATKNNRLLYTTLRNVPQKPQGTTWLNYVRCHDDIGLGYEDGHARWSGYSPWEHRQFLINFLTGGISWSFSRGRKFMEDKVKGDARISGSLASLAGLERALWEEDEIARELAIKRIILLHSFILSYGGIPLIYAGDELGYLNDYSFESEPGKSHDNRWMHRPRMNWEKAALRKTKGTPENLIFSEIKRLLTIKKQVPEFADMNNSYLVECHNEHLFSYVRILGEQKTWIICNLNDHPEHISSDLANHMGLNMNVYDRVTSKKVAFKKDGLLLEPYQFAWITNQKLK